MVMAHCGTFQYRGVVPAAGPCSDGWRLLDETAANAPVRGNHLIDNRLVGLRPVLGFANGMLVLKAASRERAQAAAASFLIDPGFIDCCESGDVVHLVRTGTGDIAVSVLREQRLIIAFGALTAVSLGDGVTVRLEPGPVPVPQDVRSTAPQRRWPHFFGPKFKSGSFFSTLPKDPAWRAKYSAFMKRTDRWVEVDVAGKVARLQEAQKTVVDGYAISVLRTSKSGVPGTYECIAISREGTCDHAVARACAERVAVWNAGLIIDDW